MHFAFPPRKTSNPPPYAARQSPRSPILRRSQLKPLALIALGAIAAVWLLSKLFGGGASIPASTPPVVIVTTLDENMGKVHNEKIKENRRRYAAKHGYETFFPNTTSYRLLDSPVSWAKVPSVRHAMALYPYTEWFFYLAPTALIMEPSYSVEKHITDDNRVESLMIRDIPVVPPDSVIKTLDMKPDRVNLILTQDKEGLSQDSFLIKRGDWAKYFLDAWFDPLYRSYNFQKAEAHALEHIVQWHGTMLAKLALVPQRIMNSYAKDDTGSNQGGVYLDGDFVASFPGCNKPKRSCETEMHPYFEKAAAKESPSGP